MIEARAESLDVENQQAFKASSLSFIVIGGHGLVLAFPFIMEQMQV